MPQSRQKKFIYTHKNQMRNIQMAMKLKEKQSKKGTGNSDKVGKVTKKNEDKISINKLREYTINHDTKYDTYKNNRRFKELSKKNPTIYVVNVIFLIILKKSFIEKLLLSENKELADCLAEFILLDTKKSTIITQLKKHGFNTIYDILLENPESVYLYSFLAYVSSLGIINNPDKFVEGLKKNKLHHELTQKEVIQQLQISNLYSRVKRFQLTQ